MSRSIHPSTRMQQDPWGGVLLPPVFIGLFLLLLMQTDGLARQASNDGIQRVNGLLGTYSIGNKSTTRVDSDVQFNGTVHEQTQAWTQDTRLPAIAFRANWKGWINIAEDGRFKFYFHGVGKFRLRIAEKDILQGELSERGWRESVEVELLRGPAAIEVEYTSGESASLGLYWSSNTFHLEPIETHLLTCEVGTFDEASDSDGTMLSRALRCQACHFFKNSADPLPGPSLRRLKENLKPEWIVEHLTAKPPTDGEQPLDSRRMPYYELSESEALAVVAALWERSEEAKPTMDWSAALSLSEKKRKAKDPPIRTVADIDQGQQTFVSLGCIACHAVGEMGRVEGELPVAKLFAGSDLTGLTQKRSSAAIARWLEDPSLVNSHHRMPKFELSLNQKLDLHAFLTQETQPDAGNKREEANGKESKFTAQQVANGRQLIRERRCAACHQLPPGIPIGTGVNDYEAPIRIAVHSDSQWSQGCLSEQTSKYHPSFRLTKSHVDQIKKYLTNKHMQAASVHPQQILTEHNCLNCHRRGTEPGIFKHFIDLAENYPELATKLAGMTPPALNGVGDKLHHEAIVKALGAHPERLREWLDIRMPQFDLQPQEIQVLADYFISHDRIPDRATDGVSEREQPTVSNAESDTANQAYWLAAGRLVTPDGFSCQSCHQIADSKPAGIALNAHGTDLTLVGRRIREPWFYRWVKNPARITPRMEMPAIQTPVHGVLDGKLDTQLHALWLTLNRPDFRPPTPNPVRVVRNHNDGASGYTHVLTDVIETPTVVVRPLILGLPNRHNWMIDLATGNLRNWWLGDVARQRTRGKSWYWEPGAQSLLGGSEKPIESWAISDDSAVILKPQAPDGQQFSMELDSLQHMADGVVWTGRLHFANADGSVTQTLKIQQRWRFLDDHRCQTEFEVVGLRKSQSLVVQTMGEVSVSSDSSKKSWRSTVAGGHYLEYESSGEVLSGENGRLEIRGDQSEKPLTWRRTMVAAIPADKFSRLPSVHEIASPKVLDCVPGFLAIDLPLPRNEMPISFAWDKQSRGFIGSLKGRVLELLDTNSDGFEDTYKLVSDEIPTPYGLYAGEDGLDVLAKFGLLRLTPSNSGSPIMDFQVVADGWGYTPDYHDWAVGLERDTAGNYYATLPCQQDDRSPAAAHWRGHALRLVPKEISNTSERKYRVESIAAGLRFPMGLALNRDGDLFTSDNQGNYTPFNELNHIREGKRYGFINKLENKNGFSPPFESPAINIPHPWMRSVNGICFLDTPVTAKSQPGRQEKIFGPFEGHLLGCEMNGRCMVRMSLQKVNDQYQGAVYPFSFPNGTSVSNFEGPIVCKVAPNGSIYVGNLHDSGWGGGNNTGSIVRLTPTGEWPLGIAEVQATSDGLNILLTSNADVNLASNMKNYSIRSYIRTPTPAYGGEDQKEKIEQIESLVYDDPLKTVRIKLGELREGAVYEINVGNIGPLNVSIFPNQAHYTMRSVPTL